ncbi:DUF1796 family putative cysteine peptidase [Priestia endophytica]
MKFEEIKGSYDLMVGLGSWCGPALHLRRHNLRRFSFPLDWVISNSLPDVSRLLKNRFQGFMELKNMKWTEGYAHLLDDGDAIFPPEGGTEPVNAHFIEDTYSNIISVHDFPVIPNQDWEVLYPSYKEKLNQRINRFLEKVENSSSILFIRWGVTNPNEAVELKSILSEMTSGKFNILILNAVSGLQEVMPIDWGIDGIASIQVPLENPNDNNVWDYAFQGLTLTDRWNK